METGQTEKGRISNWMDRLGEYDFKLYYRSSRDQYIGIVDGLSRMSTRLLTVPRAEDQERITIAAIGKPNLERYTYPRKIAEGVQDRMAKYEESPMYHQLVRYIRGGEEALNKMDLTRNRKRYLR